MESFKNKIAVVTGGGGDGIGNALRRYACRVAQRRRPSRQPARRCRAHTGEQLR